MSSVVLLVGSPGSASRTASLARYQQQRLAELGVDSAVLELRELPAQELLQARTDTPALSDALSRIEHARGVIILTPVYKAAYSGLLKAFLDVLPQFGLSEKVVLPMAVGGSLAHVLAIDYALGPVLSSLGALHIVPGVFVLDRQIERGPDGAAVLHPDALPRLDAVTRSFVNGLRRAALAPAC